MWVLAIAFGMYVGMVFYVAMLAIVWIVSIIVKGCLVYVVWGAVDTIIYVD